LKNAKKKSAFRQGNEIELSLDLSQSQLNDFLYKKYGYGLWEYFASLYASYLLFEIFRRKKNIRDYQTRINKLRQAKKRTVEYLDQFMANTRIWEAIKKRRKEEKNVDTKSSPTNRERIVINLFNLSRYFDFIDKQIVQLSNSIDILRKYGPNIQSIRIKQMNFVLLVWTFAMKKKDGSIDFENIYRLITWFLNKLECKEYFNYRTSISIKTPQLTYNKYIRYSKNNKYENLAFLIFNDYMDNITIMIKNDFPNPVDYLKVKAQTIAQIAK